MGRIIGLDFGERKIGVAVSDELKLCAHAVCVLERKSIKKDLENIGKIARKYSADSVVVGLPLQMDGSEGESAGRALAFANLIKKTLHLPVETFDERLTTVCSEKILIQADVSRRKRKEVVDKVAATILLQSFLDAGQ